MTRSMKPDRFERMVMTLMASVRLVASTDESPDALEARWRTKLSEEFINLLRREHQWMRQMVQHDLKRWEAHIWNEPARAACNDILIKLEQRRK